MESCLSSIILSPLNGYVKMSPYETGDIRIEPERIATSGGDYIVREGKRGVCQSRLTAVLKPRHVKRLRKRIREGGEAALAHASRGRPSPAACLRVCGSVSCIWPAPLCRFQRSSPLRKTGRDRRYLARPRDPPPSAPPERDRIAPKRRAPSIASAVFAALAKAKCSC